MHCPNGPFPHNTDRTSILLNLFLLTRGYYKLLTINLGQLLIRKIFLYATKIRGNRYQSVSKNQGMVVWQERLTPWKIIYTYGWCMLFPQYALFSEYFYWFLLSFFKMQQRNCVLKQQVSAFLECMLRLYALRPANGG